jgi:hypothetical protein
MHFFAGANSNSTGIAPAAKFGSETSVLSINIWEPVP